MKIHSIANQAGGVRLDTEVELLAELQTDAAMSGDHETWTVVTHACKDAVLALHQRGLVELEQNPLGGLGVRLPRRGELVDVTNLARLCA